MRAKNKTRRLKLKRSKLRSLKRPKLRKRRKTKKRGGAMQVKKPKMRPLAKPNSGLKPPSKEANPNLKDQALVGLSYRIT